MDFIMLQKHLQTHLTDWTIVFDKDEEGLACFPKKVDASGIIYNSVLDAFISVVPFLRRHGFHYYFYMADKCFCIYRD